MNRRLGPAVILAFLFALGSGGCKRKAADASQQPRESIPQPPEGAGMDGVNAPIAQLLSTEGASRPSGTPSAEQVFAAIEKTGLTLSNPIQVLGRTIGASFCKNVNTPSGVVFSVCEFKDAASAARGRDYSIRVFSRALPDRDLVVNRDTLLTITRPDQREVVKSESEKATQAFKGLSS